MRIMITAGDPSADTHAARLMNAIRTLVPEVVFEGFGGPAMEMEGLRSIARIQDLAVTGFWEVAKRASYFTSLLQQTELLLHTRKPHVFIPVDYPGFNMRLAAKAKASGVPVTWYIAPQLWAWGKNRAKKLARVVDRLLVVFPFEVAFFEQFGIRARWVGHPFVPPANTGQHANSQSVVLMPGSRLQELRHHVPLLQQVVSRLPDALGYAPSMVIPRARLIAKGALAPLENAGAVIVDDAHEAMMGATAGLIKAGTSTLEAALLNLPFATFYRTSALSYAISKQLVKIESVTMMNLLLNRNVVNEFIQGNATSKALVTELVSLLTDSQRRIEFHNACSEVRTALGIEQGGLTAAERAAKEIVEFVQ